MPMLFILRMKKREKMVRKLLENRVAIISGGARGIGKAISISLAKQGCNIIIIDPGYSIDGKKIENKNISNETAEKISHEYRVNAKSYPTDITRYQEVKNIFQETKESFGTIDIIVNNAAVLRDSFIFKLEEKNWKKVIETNLSGSFNLISCGSKIMREHKKANEEYSAGRILNIISSSGIWGNYGQAAYASEKAGLIALTKVTALDLRRSQIQCNAIAPFGSTRVTESIIPQNAEQKKYKDTALKIKSSYVGELASVLAGDSGKNITGQIFGVRGKEVFIFNNANPVYTHTRDSDNINDLEKEIKDNFTRHLDPLKTDLEVFSSDPIL